MHAAQWRPLFIYNRPEIPCLQCAWGGWDVEHSTELAAYAELEFKRRSSDSAGSIHCSRAFFSTVATCLDLISSIARAFSRSR